jgi:hypothetical protein
VTATSLPGPRGPAWVRERARHHRRATNTLIMKQLLQARSTEYRGVKFRSKSEAVLARCLDLANYCWMYEPYPSALENCPAGHSWDFLVWVRHETCGRIQLDGPPWLYNGPVEDRYIPVLVEYKPIRPTDTYLENLRDRSEHFYRSCPVKREDGTAVVWGNPWAGESQYKYEDLFCRVCLDGLVDDLTAGMKSAAQFRFDLPCSP